MRGRFWDKRLGTVLYLSRYTYVRTHSSLYLLHRSHLLVVPLQRFSIQTRESTHTILTCTSKEFKEFLGNQTFATDVLSDGGGAATCQCLDRAGYIIVMTISLSLG